jgi:hypothetical protein
MTLARPKLRDDGYCQTLLYLVESLLDGLLDGCPAGWMICWIDDLLEAPNVITADKTTATH